MSEGSDTDLNDILASIGSEERPEPSLTEEDRARIRELAQSLSASVAEDQTIAPAVEDPADRRDRSLPQPIPVNTQRTPYSRQSPVSPITQSLAYFSIGNPPAGPSTSHWPSNRVPGTSSHSRPRGRRRKDGTTRPTDPLDEETNRLAQINERLRQQINYLEAIIRHLRWLIEERGRQCLDKLTKDDSK